MKSSLFHYAIFDNHIWLLLDIEEVPPLWTHSAWAQLEIHCEMHWWRWLLNTVLSIPFCVLHRKEGGYITWESSLLKWDQSKRTTEWLVSLHWRHLMVVNPLWFAYEPCKIASLQRFFRNGMQICTHENCKYSHWAERALWHTTVDWFE